MGLPTDIADYLRLHGPELGTKVLAQFPPLHQPGDPIAPEIGLLKRKPFPAQAAAIMGIVRRWETARTAAAIAECGTGKTLISLGSIFTHAKGKPFTALAMVPPQLVEKWARECFLTIPGVRVFIIDGVRNGVASNGHTGLNEVRLRYGRIVREGLKTTLSDLRLAKGHRSPRARWNALVEAPSVWICSRERGKLAYFWRHSYMVPKSGPHIGHVVNPDTGKPVLTSEDQLRRADFKKAKHAETIFTETTKCRRTFHSPLWQADNTKIARMAPIEFIGRYLKGFFDYAIADEVHELKGGATAQGNALGTLAAAAGRIAILTGTLLGGYADELFYILYRLDAGRMLEEGCEHSETGVRQFMESYGVLEKITTIEPTENACSKARVKSRTKRRPGASPLLFGKFLLEMGAFVSLEDISATLPPYREEILSVEMDPVLKDAYEEFEEEVRKAIREHPGNSSVVNATMNGLLVYPDHPYGLGRLWGYETDPESGERSRFLIAEPRDLPQSATYAKEQRLIEEIRRELNQGRRVQVFAVYTRKYNVLARLCERLRREGVRADVLTAAVPPEQREA
ncbi:MAG: hypothetical protein GY953_14065, partial [bacterium]|nr:hypothetical protein [bacterium]